ncbi:MBL fold metallo-hydrolase [Yoonia sp. R2331]|uniref:MBL fold metallo-hydrolase n=1 Tax=Yoonia sp. R2331 TaxID=3237238 RepID=UPI0034E403C4
MAQTRRVFLTQAAAAGTITFLPFQARGASHAADSFETPAGPITVHPVDHASIIFETPLGTIAVDPVGEMSAYDGLPKPDLILVTHEHGDHFNEGILDGLMTDQTRLITNPAVYDKLPDDLKAKAESLGNDDATAWNALGIAAIPAHNLTEGRMNFHPPGRDNGYVLTFEGFRVYISGDTEDIPEMRALQDIDLAFVCMNLPFTMDLEAAASAVSDFAPRFVYPYHYRGRDGGTQDPMAFAALIGDGTEVKFAPWYGDEIMPA